MQGQARFSFSSENHNFCTHQFVSTTLSCCIIAGRVDLSQVSMDGGASSRSTQLLHKQVVRPRSFYTIMTGNQLCLTAKYEQPQVSVTFAFADKTPTGIKNSDGSLFIYFRLFKIQNCKALQVWKCPTWFLYLVS